MKVEKQQLSKKIKKNIMEKKEELICDVCPKCGGHSTREEFDFDCDGGTEEWRCTKCNTDYWVTYEVKIIDKAA